MEQCPFWFHQEIEIHIIFKRKPRGGSFLKNNMHKEKNKDGGGFTEIKGIVRQLGSPLFQNKARKYHWGS